MTANLVDMKQVLSRVMNTAKRTRCMIWSYYCTYNHYREWWSAETCKQVNTKMWRWCFEPMSKYFMSQNNIKITVDWLKHVCVWLGTVNFITVLSCTWYMSTHLFSLSLSDHLPWKEIWCKGLTETNSALRDFYWKLKVRGKKSVIEN